ncbi:MAG: LacI family DNA-binding transcriptional regulator [Spirochaetes bacterium]|nr:LacI family DNA-binding transcriptional regulator [Spirochaetota bacterium]
MTKQRRITLTDVAKEAGVSGCLASKIISGKDEGVWIAAETKERILKAAHKLNYKPNLQARQLARGRKDAIGIFIDKSSDFNSRFVMASVKGIVTKAEELGFTVNLGLSHPGSDIKLIETGAIDSAILIPADRRLGEELEGTLTREHIPTIKLNPGLWVDENSVCCDDTGGMKQAVAHLTELGHRRIVYIGSPTEHASGGTRLAAYRNAMAEAALEALTLESGTILLPEIVEQAVRGLNATAVILYHDEMLVDLHMACNRLGIRIPDDLSVVGINDLEDATRFIPATTDVHIPIFDMGIAAVELLEKQIRLGAPVPSVLIPESLIVRDSCAPVTDGVREKS